MTDQVRADEPMYVISVAARLVQMHPQTLRYYERAGLVKPTRSRGRIRLYSQRDIERLRKISRLVDDLGVNLAGVEVILNLTEKLESLQRLLERHNIEVESDYDEPAALELEQITLQPMSPHALLQPPKAAEPKTRRSRKA